MMMFMPRLAMRLSALNASNDDDASCRPSKRVIMHCSIGTGDTVLQKTRKGIATE